MTAPPAARISGPSFSEFDPAASLGRGRTVIEASAGTGKTFTISALVARLVALEGVPLDEILVVTFTNAATAELRDRVRRRLVATHAALTGVPPPDPDEHLAVILAADPATKQQAAARLHGALSTFDRAQIFTIHGFAARLLGHLGLRARLSPDLEPAEIDELLLAQTAGDLIVGRYAHPAAGGRVGEPMKAHQVIAIGRAVSATPDAEIVPAPAAVDGEALARVELAHALRTEMARRMRRAGLVSFDDGLMEVSATLADPAVGAAARTMLARRYTVALVDESQDTDPIQWQVIRAVFDESRLVVIGDPKQSIYSFRGADVEAYLSALDGAVDLRTLDTNWRSDGPLIDALDSLFSGAGFGDPRITYRQVRPAPDHAATRIRGIEAPLVIRRFAADLDIPATKRRGFQVEPLRRVVAADAANRIVGLLTGGVEIDGDAGPEALRPDHIAVLCRTRKQVDLVRAELSRRAVPSVAARTGGVFASEAAEEWRRFLHGVESPDSPARVRLAAGSLLVGRSNQEVAAMSDEEVLDLQRRLRRWQELLHGDGVPGLVAEIDRTTGLSGRVLATPNGERLMTDLTHIAEEMHAVWRRRRIGSLVGWLEAAMTEAEGREEANAEEPESRQRRLETDAAAVQVQTVHAAKGLQWPVVLVPYAWDVWVSKPSIPVFHADPSGDGPRERRIDVGGPDAPEFADHVERAMAEDAGEEGRLLYVALTRAEHHLQTWWIEGIDRTADSKLHELVTAAGRSPNELVAAAGGTVAMPVLTALPAVERYRPQEPAPATLERARFSRRLDHWWRRASFSSLSPIHPLDAGAETAEAAPKADEVVPEPVADEALVPVGVSVLAMADLPRGARFGTLLHEVIEQVPFDAPDLEGSVRAALDPQIRVGGWDFDPDAFVAAVGAALTTPLGPEPDAARLVDLDPARTFAELSFELPVRTDRGTVSLADIGRVMGEHLPATDPYRGYAATLAGFPETRFRGYLTGAVDLTAVMPNLGDSEGPVGDRYVVVDYKSNALPMLGEVASPLDYGPGPLAGAMVDGNYVLQATLYQVALHRYLQWRLAGYDPQRHLGGAMYLFVRGMAGPDAPVVDGERCGVARWRPPVAMIVALSELFRDGSP